MRSVLLDTNLFLLLIVGQYDKASIGKHRRTRSFEPEDFDLLIRSIDGYDQLWITSHSLAEVSNLLNQTNSKQARELMAYFSAFAGKARESHIPKEIIFDRNVVVRLGVADTGIIVKSKRVSCVFTVDFELYSEVLRIGNSAINFNHLRDKRLRT